MKSSIEIHNELRAIDSKVSELENKFNSADADGKDAIRDAINECKGERTALNDMLGDVLNEEDKIRRGGGVPLAATPKEFKPRNMAERILGNPADFKGVKVGDTFDATVSNAYTDFGLIEYKETDYSLPPAHIDGLPNFGIIDTLPKATTNADVLSFFESDPTKYDNKAATWNPGATKPTSKFGWKQRSAHMELIANGVPVLETNLADYGQLASMINNELRFMQEMVKAEKVVNGPSSNAETGIVGLTQHDGIQKYTKKGKDTVADSIKRMSTDVLLATGFRPTTVAMHPFVSEYLQLEKDANGRYINHIVDGKMWALQVVDDLNLEDESHKYGMMVYWPQAATFFTREGETLNVGTVNDQFMRNELTVRLEGRYGLKVTFPKAFSYLADTGITRA